MILEREFEEKSEEYEVLVKRLTERTKLWSKLFFLKAEIGALG